VWNISVSCIRYPFDIMKLHPDKISIQTTSDNGVVIKLSLGEYERPQAAILLALDPEDIKEWEVKIPEEK